MQTTQLKHPDRLLFLRMFTIELIKNTKPLPYPEKFIQELGEEKQPIPQQIQLIPSLPTLSIKPILPQHPPQFQPPQRQPQFSALPMHLQMQGSPLTKIETILKDPLINMLECPGPGKLVLVRTLGAVKTTQISLNEEEIRQVINQFSEQARIPLMTGIFKAAVGNLIITAVLSEFAGSRFIISKAMG